MHTTVMQLASSLRELTYHMAEVNIPAFTFAN